MKRIILSAFAFGLLSTTFAQVDRSKAPSPSAAKEIQFGESQSFTLENGLQVIVVENDKLPKVRLSLVFDIDPALEKGKTGLRELYGEMFLTGTTNKSKDEFNEEVDYLGASINASSSGLYASCLKKHLPAVLDLYKDALFNPTFNAKDLEKSKTAAKSGIESSKSDPASMASNVGAVVNFGKNHPYGEITTEETIDNIAVEDFKKYYDTYWKPNTAYLVVVGDIKLKEVKKLLKGEFTDWEKGLVPTHTYKPSEQPKSNQVVFVNKEGAVQSTINIIYPVDYKPGSADAAKVSLMNSILGGGIFSGRLMQNLREDKAYTYGARSSFSSDEISGEFTAYADVRNEVTDSAVTEFLFEINRLATEPVTEEELQLAKNSITGSFGRGLESPSTIATFALRTKLYGLPADYYQSYLQKIDAVTVADIQETAKKYLKPENLTILVVGDKEEVADKLKKFDSDGKISYYDYKGDPVTEFLQPAPEGVTVETVLDQNLFKTAMVNSYEEAVAKNESIKTLEMHYSLAVNGMSVTQDYYLDNGKMSSLTKMGPQVIAKQVFDGEKGSYSGMQGAGEMDTEMIDALKSQANTIKTAYKDELDQYELKGIAKQGDKEVYKIVKVDEEGNKSSMYVDTKTYMMVSSSETFTQGEQSFTQTTNYEEFKDVDGLLIPSKIIQVTGPQKIEISLIEAKVNGEIDPTVFQ